jgi:hypothetical protein
LILSNFTSRLLPKMRFTSQSVLMVLALAAECHAKGVRTQGGYSAVSAFGNTKTSAVAGSSTSAATKKATGTATSSAVTASGTAALNATVLDCFITVPANPLTAEGLATPYLLQPPCSMAVAAQQAFAEAAIFDPTTGNISIYHPLVSNAGTPPLAAPVVPTLPAGAVVGLWFGFNGGVLQLLDANGQDTNNSPLLKDIDCVNGLPGVQGDVFGQVSWCNAQAWFTAANQGVASGLTVVPDLGTDTLGNACPTSRSFEIVDACPSDNVPTQYLLSGTATAQDTAANKAAEPNAEVINNASDEALLANIIDPLIGCTPFLAPSLDNPGEMVPALALSELQASAKQLAPIGLVPLNDPDTLLTASGTVSTDKTNAYRLGVNQPPVAAGTDSGALVPFCQDMVSVAPPFFKGYQTLFTGQTTPDACVGNNLFTFLCERYLMSLTQLTCPPSAIPVQPVVCKVDGNGAATSCTITLTGNSTVSSASVVASSKAASVVASSKAASVVASSKAASVVASSKATSAASANKASVAATTFATSKAGAKAVSSVASAASTTAALSSAIAVTTAASSIPAITSSAVAVTTAAAKTIEVEVITFFTFTLSLGSPAPGVTGSETGTFFVLEEEFFDLPSAASAACGHQFDTCTALAGAAFSGSECVDQMNVCQGVASTASQTAASPATITATATVPATASASVIASITSAAGNGTVARRAGVRRVPFRY